MTLSLFRKTVAVVAAVGAAIAFALPHPVAAPPGPDLVPAAYPADDYEEHLRTALGSAFAGAWLADGGQQWIVGVTDPVLVDHLRAAGVQPRLVTHSEAELAAAMTALNQAAPPPTSVVGWYIDVTANAVVVEALPEGQAVAAKFVEASGVDTALVRIVVVAEAPQPRQPYPLREGDPFYANGGRCTIGFLVLTATNDLGYVTAGHCGGIGTSVRGFNQQPQGVIQGSVFPGQDYALAVVNQDWIPTPQLSAAQVAAVDPPVGATVCKRGSTTGLTCGTITAKNQTVYYPYGVVYGLTRTTMCSEPGDSGAPVFTPDGQPYGIVSGGSGNCTAGGTTFVQPLRPVLLAYNLRLFWY
ncbi:MAG TPA: S1 family peptidase [Natronosporangium sp.]|jgi:streptogrisin C|nr:S1 family peptidase [Natronosporangium sp.]